MGQSPGDSQEDRGDAQGRKRRVRPDQLGQLSAGDELRHQIGAPTFLRPVVGADHTLMR